MDVIALVGPSGTGKSHRALVVAHEYRADAIIDDGILIKDGKIIAGHSAKREASKIMAVRRAIFCIPGHAQEVKEAIAQVEPSRILVLGTSENMVFKIAKILSLPSVSKVVRIEDIATKAEIEKAHLCRIREGKHIIPVPTIEVKPHFSGFLIDPIESFFKKSRTKRRKLGEKSIVRPIFSYYGKLVIDDAVITALIRRLAGQPERRINILSLNIKHVVNGDLPSALILNLEVAVGYGVDIFKMSRELQQDLKKTLEHMTGMMVLQIDIKVKSLAI